MLNKLLSTTSLNKKVKLMGFAVMASTLPIKAYALSSAGTLIQGQTVAGYTDASGNLFTTQSNISILSVNQVYSSSIGVDSSKDALSNANASFTFTLTNSGNGDDTYTLVASNDSGDSGDFNGLSIYHDQNNNGVADAGEPEITSISLDMDESATLILAASLPTAVTGDTFSATLTASSANDTVDDLTTANGNDGLEGTVQGTVTVTNDAILEVTNATILDQANSTITQTITVSNVGGDTAHDVVIFSGRTTDEVAAGSWQMADMTSVVASGFGVSIDAADADPVISNYLGAGGLSEVALSLDLNGDGDTNDISEQDLGLDLDIGDFPSRLEAAGSNVGGAYGFDNALPVGTSVQLTITRDFSSLKDSSGSGSFDAVAGTFVPTEAYASWDTDDDGDVFNNKLAVSNVTSDQIPQVSGFVLAESGSDGVADNIFTINSAQAGDVLEFAYSVTNNGNSDDTFELGTANLDFPTGTLFSVLDGPSGLPLLDSNGDSNIDTGPVGVGEMVDIVVQVRIPAGTAATTTPMNFNLTASSASDPSNTQTTGGLLVEIEQTPTSISTGGEFSGFNPTPPLSGPGSCGTGSAFTALEDAKNVTNKGRYCFDLGSGEFQADVDTGEGGGWVLIMQYIHAGGTDPAKVVIGAGADLPLTSDAALGSDGSLDASSWGHAGNAAAAQFNTDFETRWHAVTSNHARKIHFYTEVGDDYMRTGTGSFFGIQTGFTPLTGHDANLPGSATDFRGDQGDSAMTNFTFYEGGAHDWTVGDSWDGSSPGFWRADDSAFIEAESTTHRVWIRSDAPASVLPAPIGTPSAPYDADPGETLIIPISFTNDGTASQAYSIDIGSTYLGGVVGSMYPGWSAVFRDNTGVIINSTPLLPVGSTFDGTVEITISTDPSEALLSYIAPTPFDDDGSTQVDGNADGDFDYPVFVGVTGSASGSTSLLMKTVDVNEVELMTFDAARVGLVQSGASVEFLHALANNGNTEKETVFSVSHSVTDWTSSIMIDTTGDGLGDYPADMLAASDTVYVTDDNGSLTAVTVNGSGEIPLPPGSSISVAVRSFAPSSAPDGQVNAATLTATFNAGSASVEVQDTITISNAQLQLYRSASVDASCADVATNDLGPDVPFKEVTGAINPLDCVVWQVVASNVGTTAVDMVNLTDSVAAFSLYKPGSLRACVGDAGQTVSAGCTFTVLDDANDSADEAYAENGTVRFDFGVGASPLLSGGTLQGGDEVTVRYAAQVE